MNNNDIDFMKLAINESRKAFNINEIPVGAIIVKDNIVIGKGYNTKEKTQNTIKHAEIVALMKAFKKVGNWRLDGAIMYTTLFPCPMCASAIQQSRIKKLYYLYDSTNLENKKISNRIFNLSPKIITICINCSDFSNHLEDFFKKIR